MRITVAAVGQRLPAWAEQACRDYQGRFPPDWKVELKAVKAEPRTASPHAAQAMAREAERLLAAAPKGARLVALDERGVACSTAQLAERLAAWQREAVTPCFLIGGADGLDAALKQRCAQQWRLSELTLPHAFARVLLLEQLYRAWSMLAGHPYHRE
jgi:23S rRNA (pseudouridine1915-N3)-methyltransferase